MTEPARPQPERYLLKRPNRWPSGRRFRTRHLRSFQIDQRIGSLLLAVAVSLLINGGAFWVLYTAKPVPLPRPEAEPIIVMLGEPAPDPDALTDLSPETETEAARAESENDADARATPSADTAPSAPMPRAVASTPATVAAVPAHTPAPATVPEPPAPPIDARAEIISVTLPPPEPSPEPRAARAPVDLPAEQGETLAADLTLAEPESPVDTAEVNVMADPAEIAVDRPRALPPQLAARAAELVDAVPPVLELATLPPLATTEMRSALPPVSRSAPELAPLPVPVAEAPELLAAEAPVPAPAVALPQTSSAPVIEGLATDRPELLAPAMTPPEAPAPPVIPPSPRPALSREALPEPELAPDLRRPERSAPPRAPALPEPRRPELAIEPPARARVELPLATRMPEAPAPMALPPRRSAEAEDRDLEVRDRRPPAPVLPRDRPALAAPLPVTRPALPPPTAAEAGELQAAPARPALDRTGLSPSTAAPARLDPALLAESDAATNDSASTARAAGAGNDADFGLPSSRPGSADGLDWADSIRAASRRQVDEESAARRSARAPWQRDEAWFADDPPARMQQLLRDDPGLARSLVSFLVATLANGAAQTPRTLYQVGPDPGVLIDLWLDRHHGNLQLACLRDAAAMPAAARRVLCPGERTEALEFDAARPRD